MAGEGGREGEGREGIRRGKGKEGEGREGKGACSVLIFPLKKALRLVSC